MRKEMLRSLVFGLVLLAATAMAMADTVMRINVDGKGTIVIKLYTAEAPKATQQIMRLAKEGFYDGQRFHKVDRTPRPFLVQIGAPGSRTKNVDDRGLLSEGSGARIPYEKTPFSFNAAGVVGLSTLPEDRNSGDSQFFILLDRAPFLDGNYTVIGKVTSGLDVLQKLEKGDKVTSISIQNT